MFRQDTRTALPHRSIWLGIPEDEFRQHLVSLEERTNAVPVDPQIFKPIEWSSAIPRPLGPSYTLSIESEQQIADDFAALVAVEEGAQSVAAVCVEEQVETQQLVLRFAALDTTSNDSVRRLVTETLHILQNVTSDDVNISDEIEGLLVLVIQLHYKRLLARLRSVKWAKPKFLSKTHKKPLWQDFPNLIHRVQFLYTRKENSTRLELEKAVSVLSAEYERFESVATQAEIATAIHLVKSSYELCTREDFKEFIRRLEDSIGPKATPQFASASKSIRQIQKIAGYRRICVSLVGAARRHPLLFSKEISVEYLRPYQSIPTSIHYESWAKTCHVHAEVQLAVFYDLRAQNSTEQGSYLHPRCMGISKWLCYLCYQFIKAHGSFFPSRTHGRLYDQWTIPDLVEFHEGLAVRYRRIVQTIDCVVTQQTQNEPELWRVEPMTSMEVDRE